MPLPSFSRACLNSVNLFSQCTIPMIKIAVIDNYDSFTFNLVHYLEALDCAVTVLRNDEFDLDELEDFDKILLSPGPGVPENAGLLKQTIRDYFKTKPILGICLGQQAIAEVFGGTISNLDKVYHGVASSITAIGSPSYLFEGISFPMDVGRYHSWSVDTQTLPDVLEATTVDAFGNIMSLQHREYDVQAVQFHPESVLTPDGMRILKNWVTR